MPATYFYPGTVAQPPKSIAFSETRMISLARPFDRGPPTIATFLSIIPIYIATIPLYLEYKINISFLQFSDKSPG